MLKHPLRIVTVQETTAVSWLLEDKEGYVLAHGFAGDKEVAQTQAELRHMELIGQEASGVDLVRADLYCNNCRRDWSEVWTAEKNRKWHLSAVGDAVTPEGIVCPYCGASHDHIEGGEAS